MIRSKFDNSMPFCSVIYLLNDAAAQPEKISNFNLMHWNPRFSHYTTTAHVCNSTSAVKAILSSHLQPISPSFDRSRAYDALLVLLSK